MKKLVFNMVSEKELNLLAIKGLSFKLGSGWDVQVGNNKLECDVLVTDNTTIANYSQSNFILGFVTDENKGEGLGWKAVSKEDKLVLLVSNYEDIYKICKGLM